MALLGREFIAVPDDRKGQIVFKWPDVSIRRYTRAIVNADEMAMFVNTGQVVQTLGPGRHQIDANELPGLGVLIDAATGGNAYRAELYFVGTREYTGFKFGGRVDDVQDPRTGLVVTLRVFGDYALRVADPVRLVTNLTATVDVTDNERIAGWVSDQLLKVLRTHVTTQIIRNGWPILGLMAYSAEIEQNTIEAGNGQLAAYGVQLTRMGNFDVNLSPEDEQQLKQLAKDTSYSQLAGGFQNYAAGEMALGAGQGLAKGGAGTEGAFLACSFWLVNALQMIGHEDRAHELFDKLLSLRNDLGLLSEEDEDVSQRMLLQQTQIGVPQERRLQDVRPARAGRARGQQRVAADVVLRRELQQFLTGTGEGDPVTGGRRGAAIVAWHGSADDARGSDVERQVGDRVAGPPGLSHIEA